MGVARIDRLHCRLEAGGIAHLGIAVTGGPGRRRGVAATGMHVATHTQMPRRHAVDAVIFRQQGASDVDLAAADMGMQVDGAGHHHAPGEVDFRIDHRIRAGVGDDMAILNVKIAHQAVDAMGGIVRRPPLSRSMLHLLLNGRQDLGDAG